jgi:hypothetical protein
MRGQEPVAFPRDDLAARLRLRAGAGLDALELLEESVHALVPERGPIEELAQRHGILGFMMLVQLANEAGRMLVEVDPRFTSLSDLFEQEALADESEWLDWQDRGAR